MRYYSKNKLCDVSAHMDHISVYIGALSVNDHPVGAAGVVVGGTNKYIHSQVRGPDDLLPVVALLKEAYENQAATTG